MGELTTINQEAKSGIAKLVKWAAELVVCNPEDRALTVDAIRQAKAHRKQVVKDHAEMKQKTHAAWKSVVASEKKYTDILDKIESIVKRAVLLYDREVEVARAKEQARLQAIVDEKARRERERLEKEAAKLKTPELKAQRMEEAQEVIAPVVQVAEPEKRKGESTPTTWKHRIVNIDELDRQYMIPNDKMLAGIATSTKGNIKIAGVEFYPHKSLSIAS